MRDFEKETPGTTLQKNEPQSNAPVKSKARGESDQLLQHAHGHDADSHAKAHTETIRNEHLSHPANAEPLADLLGHLQHSHGNTYVQRVVSDLSDEKSNAESKPEKSDSKPESVRSLDAGTRSQMESTFGENFGDVRVHTGERAADASAQLGARAFTRGRDIYFNAGEYDPSTRDGKEVLAHELAHVVQQRGSSSNTQAYSIDQAGDVFEQEADQAAASLLRGQRAHVENRSATPAFQRQQPGQHGAERRRRVHSHPVHLYLDERQGGVGFPPSGNVSFRFDEIASNREHILVLTLPPGMTYGIHQGYGRTYHAEPAEPPAPVGERVVTVRVPKHERERPIIRMTFYQGNVEFRIHFHFYRRAQTP
jgi:hypothetical protein